MLTNVAVLVLRRVLARERVELHVARLVQVVELVQLVFWLAVYWALTPLVVGLPVVELAVVELAVGVPVPELQVVAEAERVPADRSRAVRRNVDRQA